MSRWLILFCLVFPVFSAAAELSGEVIGIMDGDTFLIVTDDNKTVDIRLAEIDAPEAGQPYGNRSKQILAKMSYRKNVRIEVQTVDRYGRIVGRPYIDDLDVCAEMVRMGAAWAYRQYLRDKTLLTIESEAKAAKRGLWGLSEAQNMPPWEWRRSGDQNPNGCDIKGNINSRGDKIYHVPGTSSYGATRINESKGERWFCSEAEASAAGWRAPRN